MQKNSCILIFYFKNILLQNYYRIRNFRPQKGCFHKKEHLHPKEILWWFNCLNYASLSGKLGGENWYWEKLSENRSVSIFLTQTVIQPAMPNSEPLYLPHRWEAWRIQLHQTEKSLWCTKWAVYSFINTVFCFMYFMRHMPHSGVLTLKFIHTRTFDAYHQRYSAFG